MSYANYLYLLKHRGILCIFLCIFHFLNLLLNIHKHITINKIGIFSFISVSPRIIIEKLFLIIFYTVSKWKLPQSCFIFNKYFLGFKLVKHKWIWFSSLPTSKYISNNSFMISQFDFRQYFGQIEKPPLRQISKKELKAYSKIREIYVNLFIKKLS